jgi:hypothetical protein
VQKRPVLLATAAVFTVLLVGILGCAPPAEQTTGTVKEFTQSADGQTLAVVVVDGAETTQTAWIKIRGLAPGEKVVLEESAQPGQSGLPTITVVGHAR